ncbi:aminoglycoside 6'-N-acetyltransferase [Devosia aquimaris]|uniref:aminoglycoside 6'-N-acetyltransferase n=1 Tax=Devosia aquimaris TaxID=2866214 RepID=UPI001CD0A702|nr:aminoglycoside 6'-N-acetyltransferase [Devosia sp. CJK-A8-3]
MKITLAGAADSAEWATLRQALWPYHGLDRHRADIAQLLETAGDTANFIARTDEGVAIGLAEAALRHDYVEGCKSSPVAFLEGIYVDPAHRRHGVARQLVDAVEGWAVDRGIREFASDAALDNLDSHRMHAALGFEETQRVVFFRKLLRP